VPQDHITLERFPQYWNAAAIHLDRVIYQSIPDSSIRLANLQAGSLEIADAIAPTDVDTVKKDPKLRIASMSALGFQTIAFNLANGPSSKTPLGQDSRVRRAFELSLDRNALVQVVYNGLFVPTAQVESPASPFYLKDIQPPPRDVAKAKALLKEAGVDVHITASEYASALNAANRGDFEAFLTAWSGRVDPDGNLYSFLHTGAPSNDAKYANAKVDEDLDKARLVADVAQRRALYDDLFHQTVQDLPILYLWQLENLVGLSAKVNGFVQVPDGMIRLQGVTLGK
jgi:peptide/nickel transport system substrate-binding protein